MPIYADLQRSLTELEILDCNQAAAYLLEKEDSYTWVVQFRRNTDTPVTSEITLRRVQYGDRELLVGTAHDITERELLTQRLRNSLRKKDVMLREIHQR